MNIFLLSGYAGSGKSFAATWLQRCLNNSRLAAFADPIKDGVSKEYNIPRALCDTQEGKATVVDEKGTTVRDLLIQYAAEKKLYFNATVFAHSVVCKIRENPTIESWIIHDWRYPEEYLTLIGCFPEADIYRIRIVRSSVQSLPIPSEHGLDDYPFDHTIYNDGTAEELIEAFVDQFGIDFTID